MNPGTSYPEGQLAILLGGDSGSGKTCTGFMLPSVYVIDFEGNLASAKQLYPTKQDWWYDNPEFGPDGKRLPNEKHWQRMADLIEENCGKPEVKSIMFDGLGRAAQALKDYLVAVGAAAGEKLPSVGNEKQMNQALWEPYAKKLMSLVWKLKSYQKPLLVTCHLKVDENEMTAVKEQRVGLQGRLVTEFPRMFSCFWQAQALPSTDPKFAKSGGVRYFIRNAPTNRLQLKALPGLPAEFEVTDPAFQALVKAACGTTGAPAGEVGK